jgi:dephospho-CoA kinase
MHKKEIIGLTGETGTGKSTFAAFLSQHPDVCVIDSDQISKDILFDSNNRTKLIEIFGDDTSKEEIAKIIFSIPEKKKELENFIHPKVWEKINEIIKQSNKKIIFIESAIIYETHSEKIFKKIVLVTCNPDEQQKRIKEKYNLSKEEIVQRLGTLWPLDYKLKRADFIVNTDCSKEELQSKATNLISILQTPLLVRIYKPPSPIL